jgi:hypothetical protein
MLSSPVYPSRELRPPSPPCSGRLRPGRKASNPILARQVVLLIPTNVSHPRSLPSYKRNVHISSLTATHMDLFASVANKRLTEKLTPLDATLTKNMGVGVYILFSPSHQIPATTLFSITYDCPFSIPFVLTFIHVMGGVPPLLSALFCVPCASALSFSPSFAPKKKKGGGRNHRLAPPRSDSVELFSDFGLTTRGLSNRPWPASPRSWPAPWHRHPVSACGASWSGSAPCRQWCPCSRTDPRWSARP